MTAPARTRDLLVAQRVIRVLRFATAATPIRAVDGLREAGFTTSAITLTTRGCGAVAPLPRPEAVRASLATAA